MDEFDEDTYAPAALDIPDYETLLDMHDDGFNLCDLRVAPRKLESWNSSFKGLVTPFFAVKCHPDAKIVDSLRKSTICKCGFDCASAEEMAMCSDPGRTVYANPQKSVAGIRYAIENGVRNMTFDCCEELDKVAGVVRAWGEEHREGAGMVFMIARLLVPDGR